jgi:ABC-type multidrug transport system fused ATPase/permease subunit
MWRFVLATAVRHTAVLVVWAISFSWSMFPLLAIFAVSLSQPGELNLMEVFSSFWLLDHLMSQIQYIPHSLSLYGSASAGASRVITLLAQPDLNDLILPAESQRIARNATPKRIIFSHVGVRYGSHEVLKDVHLEISFDQRTAIIGTVGCGKSTLLEVLIGELPFASGAVEVEFSDGSRGALWREDVYTDFRSAIAYSPQQPFLSNTSMRDNIDLSGEASFEDVQQAVVSSQLREDIALFTRGLAEEVGESGINLSGGQKQRVSLARAFMSRRSVWVLDDPLSGVDTHTERLLMDAITQHVEGLILVTHRVSAIERCQRVIVLEAGTVVEDGDPTTLASDPSSHVYRFLQAVEEHGG